MIKKMKQRRKCPFCYDPSKVIDYKDTYMLNKYTQERGKITPSILSGVCAKHQRQLAKAIKRARIVALMPFTTD